ncbi:pyrroloquinoline quinone biosynthesis protein PqqB [Streptomyces sp. NPDC005017]|uniref:pyrroloquinoline quinone biosynthesis protein PqqB n=1 Tax=Streptomyces sp. NPDC005017 TaxID=3364706 RepID=UPI00369C6A27
MRVVLLGTAAHGGIPRWTCSCAPCAAARDGGAPARTQAGAAVPGNARDRWLPDASPDLRAQLTAVPALWPGPASRPAPVCGVLPTGAEPARTTGLGLLRGTPGLTVYAAPPLLTAFAPARAALDRYTPWNWRDGLTEEGFVLSGGLVVSAYAVGPGPPACLSGGGKDRRLSAAYRIEVLATGGVLVYAPSLDPVHTAPEAPPATADCVLLDAAALAAGRTVVPGTRLIATRLADTSPLLGHVPGAAGPEVLPDGAEFVL